MNAKVRVERVKKKKKNWEIVDIAKMPITDVNLTTYSPFTDITVML